MNHDDREQENRDTDNSVLREDRRSRLLRDIHGLTIQYQALPDGYTKDVIRGEMDFKARELEALRAQDDSENTEDEEHKESSGRVRGSSRGAVYGVVVLLIGVSLLVESFVPITLGLLLVLAAQLRRGRSLTTSDNVSYRQTLTDRRSHGHRTYPSDRHSRQPRGEGVDRPGGTHGSEFRQGDGLRPRRNSRMGSEDSARGSTEDPRFGILHHRD